MRKGFISEIFLSFQGEGICAGRRQLFVRLSGCNLRCRYCDTPGSLEREGRFHVYGPGELVTEGANPISAGTVLSLAAPLLESGPVDGVALTGGEPLLQDDFLCELLSDARFPRPRLLETNGMLPDRLVRVVQLVDVVSMDIKLPSNTGEPAFWDAHGEFLALARGKACVKILVDDGTDPAEVERAARLVREQAAETPVVLQPITGPSGCVELTAERLQAFFATARRHVDDLRVLPQAHRMLGIR